MKDFSRRDALSHWDCLRAALQRNGHIGAVID